MVQGFKKKKIAHSRKNNEDIKNPEILKKIKYKKNKLK